MRSAPPRAGTPRSKPASRPGPEYHPLIPAPPYERARRSGWRISGGPAIPLTGPAHWRPPEQAGRSWYYHLQALDLIDPLLVRHGRDGDRRALADALEVVLDWGARGRDAALPQDLVWYDMAVGLRAWRMAWLWRVGRNAGLLGDGRGARLAGLMAEHRDRLMDEAGFTPWSNHGFFQAAGLLALARADDSAAPGAGAALAMERLRGVLDAHFTPDGAHKEHSPDYHLFVLEGYRAILASGLSDDAALKARVDRIGQALAWFVKPDGRLANFGDSDNRAVTARQTGKPPQGLKAFAQGGYAVVRRDTPRGGGFLGQTLCFHSLTHKQADDLSVIWFDRGGDILVDAGRFAYGARLSPDDPRRAQGFRYADPRRIFCESTAAHNTVETDGASHERRRPYGSALIAAGESEGIFHIASAVERPGGRHERLLLFAPGRWLCVVDGLRGRGFRRHAYRQWHHLAPRWRLTHVPGGLRAEAGPAPDRRLHILSLSGDEVEGPWLGRTQPALQGWRSPRANRLEPAPAFAFTRLNTRKAVMATLFAFADQEPVGGRCRMSPALTGTITLDIAGRRLSIHRDRRGLGIRQGSA